MTFHSKIFHRKYFTLFVLLCYSLQANFISGEKILIYEFWNEKWILIFYSWPTDTISVESWEEQIMVLPTFTKIIWRHLPIKYLPHNQWRKNGNWIFFSHNIHLQQHKRILMNTNTQQLKIFRNKIDLGNIWRFELRLCQIVLEKNISGKYFSCNICCDKPLWLLIQNVNINQTSQNYVKLAFYRTPLSKHCTSW